jgi:hypothetical protein
LKPSRFVDLRKIFEEREIISAVKNQQKVMLMRNFLASGAKVHIFADLQHG